MFIVLLSAALVYIAPAQGAERWCVDTAQEWQQSKRKSEWLRCEEGFAIPTGNVSSYLSVIRTCENKRSIRSVVFKQSPVWHNWDAIPNLGPTNLTDAPVLLVKGPKDYWIFGRYGRGGQPTKPFKAEDATLEGFDIPLKTTPYRHQYDASGGLRKGLGGYHAWQSRDMIHWVHHGPVTERTSCWVTTAEFANGKAYIYYDYPNDQDPHLYIDDNLTDGKPGKDMGLAFNDPSHGSDCTFIRDLAGNFHVIYEDWSPLNASAHSWDSPLAGHAVSKTGEGNFSILTPAVDERTKPTGKKATYRHPHWRQHPAWKSNVAEYEIHEPEQNAFGDWAAISVGGQYYLFCDYHPANDKIRVAWFTSSDVNKPFKRVGEIGRGHPDPDVCFAEGKFYLITQMKTDYVSPGPWVEQVEARVGIDTTKDSRIDTWSDWQEVKETYDYIQGFSKQVKSTPASLDLSNLPAGFGFCFEFRTKDTTKNHSKPIIDSVTISFDEEN
ncbi:MAG: hypothetical protein ACOC7K_01930 [bacterium]